MASAADPRVPMHQELRADVQVFDCEAVGFESAQQLASNGQPGAHQKLFRCYVILTALFVAIGALGFFIVEPSVPPRSTSDSEEPRHGYGNAVAKWMSTAYPLSRQRSDSVFPAADPRAGGTSSAAHDPSSRAGLTMDGLRSIQEDVRTASRGGGESERLERLFLRTQGAESDGKSMRLPAASIRMENPTADHTLTPKDASTIDLLLNFGFGVLGTAALAGTAFQAEKVYRRSRSSNGQRIPLSSIMMSELNGAEEISEKPEVGSPIDSAEAAPQASETAATEEGSQEQGGFFTRDTVVSALLLLSFVPYLLPEERKPEIFKVGGDDFTKQFKQDDKQPD